MKVVVTGANGFIGQNMRAHLGPRKTVVVAPISRDSDDGAIGAAVDGADFVFHFAGVNRPNDEAEFTQGNADFTRRLTSALRAAASRAPIIYTSSTQAEYDNPYGASKKAAESALADHAAQTGAPVHIYRLPNVFGKWARPNYNSAVATFCHNIARDLPITIHDPAAHLNLAYIDDVITGFLAVIDGADPGPTPSIAPVYQTTVGAVADQIRAFKESRKTLVTERVGAGLARALYATYLSYLPREDFAYEVPAYADPRGVFVEILKTPDAGQFSYFTAKPGVTRGVHYHHSKTEKFLVVKGQARFGFRHIVTGERFDLFTSSEKHQIVETIPGWSHDITNVGEDEMFVVLWANEIFDRAAPDTYSHAV
jgi:UDP-2-acetamido-2,6-beta-L-arabino-hexul-4-ose reductase